MAVTPFDPTYMITHAIGNVIALSFIELELWVIEVYIVGIGIFDLFCSSNLDFDTMTFIYEHDPVYLGRYTGCANMNFSLRQGFRKLSSDRHTDIQASYAWSLLVT